MKLDIYSSFFSKFRFFLKEDLDRAERLKKKNRELRAQFLEDEKAKQSKVVDKTVADQPRDKEYEQDIEMLKNEYLIKIIKLANEKGITSPEGSEEIFRAFIDKAKEKREFKSVEALLRLQNTWNTTSRKTKSNKEDQMIQSPTVSSSKTVTSPEAIDSIGSKKAEEMQGLTRDLTNLIQRKKLNLNPKQTNKLIQKFVDSRLKDAVKSKDELRIRALQIIKREHEIAK